MLYIIQQYILNSFQKQKNKKELSHSHIYFLSSWAVSISEPFYLISIGLLWVWQGNLMESLPLGLIGPSSISLIHFLDIIAYLIYSMLSESQLKINYVRDKTSIFFCTLKYLWDNCIFFLQFTLNILFFGQYDGFRHSICMICIFDHKHVWC